MNSLKFIGMSVAVILLLYFVGESAAQNEIQDIDSLENEGKVLETVQGLLQDVQSLLDPTMADQSVADPDGKNGCTCGGLQCTCCRRIRIKVLRIKKNCCVEVAFLKETYQFEIRVKLGRKTVFKARFSVRKPKPLCADVSLIVKKGASICLQLTDVKVLGSSVSACVRLQFRMYSRVVARYKVGCFRLKGSNEAVEAVDQLELPASDGDDYDPAEDDLESTSFDGLELMGGQEDDPLSPDDDKMVFLESIEMPINNLGENQL